jgi:hypothetical protein
VFDQIEAGIDSIESYQNTGDIPFQTQHIPLQNMQLLSDTDQFVVNGTLTLLQVSHIRLQTFLNLQDKTFGFRHSRVSWEKYWTELRVYQSAKWGRDTRYGFFTASRFGTFRLWL